MKLALAATALVAVAAAAGARTAAYERSVLIGSRNPVDLIVAGSAAKGDLALIASDSGTRTPLVTVKAVAAGAAIACISAPSNRIGTANGVNLGVNVKSVAVLLDRRWKPVPDAGVAWVQLVHQQKKFENWENCGQKLEGRPSPASLLVPQADGGATDDIFDGNPGTTFSIVPRRYSAKEIGAMLSDVGESNADVRVFMTIYSDGTEFLLIGQGTQESAQMPMTADFIALYADSEEFGEP